MASRSRTTLLGKALRIGLAVWLLAALLSLAWRGFSGPQPEPVLPPDMATVSIQQDGVSLTMAYRSWGRADHPAVLLIHGSPGSCENFGRLAPVLAEHFFVIAPDLPGFGHSSLTVPDVSIEAHGRALLSLLKSLHIRRAHVVGYSMGGGPALHLWDLAPERVASLTLISSIGVQEMELLGDYHLNHALHLAQLWLLRAIDLIVPHFGRTDAFARAILYARNFAESDQRPLRNLLRRYDGPALVIHGEDDFLVPVEAAREHLRLLPQAEAWIAPAAVGRFGAADHFMVFVSPPPFADALLGFLDRAQADRATRREQASPERMAAAAARFDPASAPAARGPFAVLLVLLIALATLVSEDLTCVGAGLLAASGRLSFVAAAGGAFAGIFAGDMLLFFAGRWLGHPAVRRPPLRWVVSEAALDRGAAWFERRGAAAIFASRFVPGLRLPTYLAAGLMGTGVLRFALWFLLASLAWTPALVGLSAVAGRQALLATDWMAEHSLGSLLIVVALLLLLTRLVPALLSHRGRRRLYGRWLRLRHWEFWPIAVIYAPVLPWIGWLALRHRGLSVVLSANPGIPAGGVIGESKSEIVAHFAPEVLPASDTIPAGPGPEPRLARVLCFRQRHGLDWPLVLKPDAGQRGEGVSVCDNNACVRAWLARHPEPMLVQEFLQGLEFGVFWYRFPGAARGTLFSITEKHLPVVTGDGVRTLEQLVLDDPRAPAVMHAYTDSLDGRLFEVPAAGEQVTLTRLGTHCRGAIFLDGNDLAGDALRDAIDRMTAPFEGFCFGRLDLRAPSRQALAAGRGLKLIEANGLTSEATHIYDRRHSLLHAWAVLCRQWSIAFELGAANRRAGAPPTSLREVLALVFAYRRGKRREAGDGARAVRTRP